MSSNRIQAVEQACTELATAGQAITFIAVASRSGIPRITLYRNPALRAIVEEHRTRAHDATTLTGLAAQLASQQLALEALAAKIRQHEELLRKIRPPR